MQLSGHDSSTESSQNAMVRGKRTSALTKIYAIGIVLFPGVAFVAIRPLAAR